MEKDFVNKRFAGDAINISYLHAVIDLDPMRNITEDEKALRVATKGNTEKEYILSAHIDAWVWRAYENDNSFFTKTYEEQYAILIKMAEEFMKLNTKTLMPTNEGNNGIGGTA
jgi:hypothetical protein